MRPDFDQIMRGIIDTVHDQTAQHPTGAGNALGVIVRAAKVLAAVNRALTMATLFVESNGQFTHTFKGK